MTNKKTPNPAYIKTVFENFTASFKTYNTCARLCFYVINKLSVPKLIFFYQFHSGGLHYKNPFFGMLIYQVVINISGFLEIPVLFQ